MFSTITSNELATIKDLYINQHIGASTISKQLNRSETFVKYNLKKNGIPIRRTIDGTYRKYSLNHNYFDTIDTHNKAYWLGFLYADGCNYEFRGETKLCLGLLDRSHILKFQEAIESDQPIVENAGNKRDNTCQVAICNRNFSQSLAKLGCIQNKSLVLSFPNHIKDKHLPSFMLGYFDGDGCIYVGKNIDKAGFNITSSYDFCNGYQDMLMKKCEVNRTKLYGKPDSRGIKEHAWNMRYSGKGNIRKIHDYLYSSPVTCYLKRKKDKFDQILRPLTII